MSSYWRDRVSKQITNAELRAVVDELREQQRTTAERAAAKLAGPLNAAIRNMPSDTYEAKAHISKFVNAILADLNLGIVSPKSGHVGILLADPGRNFTEGRFKIRSAPSNNAPTETWSSITLPVLELGFRSPPQSGRSKH